jgi:hypothetical protein
MKKPKPTLESPIKNSYFIAGKDLIKRKEDKVKRIRLIPSSSSV